MPETLIYFGDAIKALDDKGKVGGYLVRFTDSTVKDLTGEYFTAETYYGPTDGDGADVLFHHGIPVKAGLEGLSQHLFGQIKTKKDDVGVWAETVLSQSDEYEKAVLKLVKDGKLKWSSGSTDRVVRREKDGKITRWPIVEASMTHTPAMPFGTEITAFKSLAAAPLADDDDDPQPADVSVKTGPPKKSLADYLNQLIDDRVDDGSAKAALIARMAREAGAQVSEVEAVLSGEGQTGDAQLKAFARALGVSFDALKSHQRRDHLKTIKGMFTEALAGRVPSRWELESVYCDVVRKQAMAASAAQMAGFDFDLKAKVQEATDEYASILLDHALSQIQSWIDEGGEEEFYLKAVIDTEASVKALASADLDIHSQLAVSALRDLQGRFRGAHNNRLKAGRVLSEKNRTRIGELMGQMKGILDALQTLLDESTPMATAEQKRTALTKHLMLKAQRRAASIGV